MVKTDRMCTYCGASLWSANGHSIGTLHAICLDCPTGGKNFCEDCDEGNV
jgi:hypothetical protein